MYIEWYIQTVQQITRTLIHKKQFTSICRGQKPASKCTTCIWNTGHIQNIAGPVAVWTDEKKKKKTLTVPIGYSLFADHRSVPSFWARILLSYFFVWLCPNRVCALISRYRDNWWYPLDITSIGIDGTPLVPGISLCSWFWDILRQATQPLVF